MNQGGYRGERISQLHHNGYDCPQLPHSCPLCHGALACPQFTLRHVLSSLHTFVECSEAAGPQDWPLCWTVLPIITRTGWTVRSHGRSCSVSVSIHLVFGSNNTSVNAHASAVEVTLLHTSLSLSPSLPRSWIHLPQQGHHMHSRNRTSFALPFALFDMGNLGQNPSCRQTPTSAEGVFASEFISSPLSVHVQPVWHNTLSLSWLILRPPRLHPLPVSVLEPLTFGRVGSAPKFDA